MDCPSLSLVSPRRARLRALVSWRLVIQLAVTAVWLAVMAQLWVREHGKGGKSLVRMGVSPEVLQVSWTDYLQWMWIQQNGRTIGLNMTSIYMPLADPNVHGSNPHGYRMETRTQVAFRVMGFTVPVEMATEVGMNSVFEMETLQAAVRAMGQELLIHAFVENRNLYYRVKLDSSPTSAFQGGLAGLNFNPMVGVLAQLPRRELCGRAPLPQPIFLTDAVLPVLTRSGTLKVGQRWITDASNPLTGMFHAPVRIAVEAREPVTLGEDRVDAWRLVEQVGEARATAWYDANGRLVQSDLGNGMRLVQTSRSEAVKVYPDFEQNYYFREKLNREWIKTHLDSKLDGAPLSQLVPALPGM